jgi:integrase
MPLRLIPPRKGWSPYYRVRGTYLGIYVDRSTKVSRRATAHKMLQKWQREIEAGEFAVPGEATFASAAVGYMQTGGERRFLAPLIEHFQNRPLSQIDQQAIDNAASSLYPNATAATRNRQVHTPVSAVMRRAGANYNLNRPKGSAGTARTTWLWPEEAERLFQEATVIDIEFGSLLITLTYTGIRLGEALALQCRDIRLDEAFAYLPTSKNEEPRAVFLPPNVVEALRSHPRGINRDEKVFRFAKTGHLYKLWRRAVKQATINLPPRSAFHILSHTWATWMRRYAGLDTKGLVGTGRWKDDKSAARYQHVVVSEESRRANLLPGAIAVQKPSLAQKNK